MRIHILGASGSGTSTLGRSLSENLKFRHFDSDDYYWKKTNPPFTEKNQIAERQRLMLSDMKELNDWVLSGSMDSWSDPFVPLFDLVIFLYVPAEARIERIKQRESERHGSRILPGGDMHQAHLDFIEWARQYDEGVLTGRNLKRHEEWLATLSCPLLRIDGQIPTEEITHQVLRTFGRKL
jgi:adenylate kinase family enzyme